MKRTIFLAAILGSLLTLISGAGAQEKNELTGLIGRTLVSDQGSRVPAHPALFSPREKASASRPTTGGGCWTSDSPV